MKMITMVVFSHRQKVVKTIVILVKEAIYIMCLPVSTSDAKGHIEPICCFPLVYMFVCM